MHLVDEANIRYVWIALCFPYTVRMLGKEANMILVLKTRTHARTHARARAHTYEGGSISTRV